MRHQISLRLQDLVLLSGAMPVCLPVCLFVCLSLSLSRSFSPSLSSYLYAYTYLYMYMYTYMCIYTRIRALWRKYVLPCSGTQEPPHSCQVEGVSPSCSSSWPSRGQEGDPARCGRCISFSLRILNYQASVLRERSRMTLRQASPGHLF